MFSGATGKEIKYKRKLLQGNPLSPLLFTLVAKGLKAIIENAREVNLIKGLPASIILIL